MKMLLLLVIAGVLYFVYTATIGASLKTYQSCMETAKALKETDIEVGCVDSQSIYQELQACLAAAQESDLLSGQLYAPSGVKAESEQHLEIHNLQCPAWKVEALDAALYL